MRLESCVRWALNSVVSDQALYEAGVMCKVGPEQCSV